MAKQLGVVLKARGSFQTSYHDLPFQLRRLPCVQSVAIGFRKISVLAESGEEAISAEQLEVIAFRANEDLDSQAKKSKRSQF